MEAKQDSGGGSDIHAQAEKIRKSLEAGPGNVSPSRLEELRAIFRIHYELPEPKRDGKTWRVYSSYVGAKGPLKGNEYLNFGHDDGTFIADNNHHPWKADNKEWKPSPSLSLSDIFFFQMAALAEKGWVWNGTIRRSNVVSQESKEIFARVLSTGSNRVELLPDCDEFFALLGTPNGRACVFLVLQHAMDLRLRGIGKIVLFKKDGSWYMDVQFTRP